MLPEKDQATATGNMQKKFGEDQPHSFRDMRGDRQTDTLITILCTTPRGKVTM